MSDNENQYQPTVFQEEPIGAEYIPNQQDDDDRTASLTVTRSSIESPFLPPRFLQEYEKIVPGSAKQIFEMSVKQHDFNIELKREEIRLNSENLERVKLIDAANIAEQKSAMQAREKEIAIKSRGQIFTFSIGLVLIGVSVYFAIIQQYLLASVPLGIVIGAMAVLFLQRHVSDGKKDQPMIEDKNPIE